MSGWIWALLIVGGYAVGWYRTALTWAHRLNAEEERKELERRERWKGLGMYRRDEPVDVDRNWNLVAGMMTGVVWPVFIPLLLLWRHMLGRVPPTDEQIRRDNDHLRREIERLEREAGLR